MPKFQQQTKKKVNFNACKEYSREASQRITEASRKRGFEFFCSSPALCNLANPYEEIINLMAQYFNKQADLMHTWERELILRAEIVESKKELRRLKDENEELKEIARLDMKLVIKLPKAKKG